MQDPCLVLWCLEAITLRRLLAVLSPDTGYVEAVGLEGWGRVTGMWGSGSEEEPHVIKSSLNCRVRRESQVPS